MARPVTDTPRLAAIDPQRLAAEVCAGVLDYAAHLLLSVATSAAGQWRLPEPDGLLDLRYTVVTLAGYAQGRHGLDAPVEEYLISLLPLWQYPAHARGSVDTPEYDRAMRGDLDDLADDWRGQLCLVMVAATGREAMSAGRPVSVAQLAALAGVSPDHVRLLARRGELDLSGGAHLTGAPLAADAATARRWLSGRGVVV